MSDPEYKKYDSPVTAAAFLFVAILIGGLIAWMTTWETHTLAVCAAVFSLFAFITAGSGASNDSKK